MKLETMDINDLGDEIFDINLTCPECEGEGCDKCEDGNLNIMWNTVWNTGFLSCGKPLPFAIGNVIVFEYKESVWFGLSGCGQDMTPYLAEAWIKVFPDCNWLPENFMIYGINLTGGYIADLVGEKMAKKIYSLMEKTAKGQIVQAKHMLRNIQTAKNLLKKA